MNGVLIEAESFQDLGGWILDTQFIYSMGSAYLNAHGLGKPVAPAKTTVTLSAAGSWHVWVRTKNWVPGDWEAPGQFKLSVNGQELEQSFGAGSGEWEWESGGAVEVTSTDVEQRSRSTGARLGGSNIWPVCGMCPRPRWCDARSPWPMRRLRRRRMQPTCSDRFTNRVSSSCGKRRRHILPKLTRTACHGGASHDLPRHQLPDHGPGCRK